MSITPNKNRSRLGRRLAELHDDEAEARQFRDHATNAFAPIVMSACIAAVISLETWLKPLFRGLEHLLVVAVLLASVVAIWLLRRRGNRD